MEEAIRLDRQVKELDEVRGVHGGAILWNGPIPARVKRRRNLSKNVRDHDAQLFLINLASFILWHGEFCIEFHTLRAWMQIRVFSSGSES